VRKNQKCKFINYKITGFPEHLPSGKYTCRIKDVKLIGPGHPMKYGEVMPVYTIRLPHALLEWCRQKGSDFIQNILRREKEYDG